jgi:hypothetical protein
MHSSARTRFRLLLVSPTALGAAALAACVGLTLSFSESSVRAQPDVVVADVRPQPAVRASSAARSPSAGSRPPETRVRTEFTESELLIALARGHLRAFGRPVEEPRLVGAFALSAFETGRGAAMRNFNFGSLEAVTPDVPHIVLSAAESQTHRVVRLRAFSTATEGAAAFWTTLRDHMPDVLEALDQRDLPSATRRLAKRRYFEQHPGRYDAALPLLRGRAERHLLPVLRRDAKRLGVTLAELPLSPAIRYVDALPRASGEAP